MSSSDVGVTTGRGERKYARSSYSQRTQLNRSDVTSALLKRRLLVHRLKRQWGTNESTSDSESDDEGGALDKMVGTLLQRLARLESRNEHVNAALASLSSAYGSFHSDSPSSKASSPTKHSSSRHGSSRTRNRRNYRAEQSSNGPLLHSVSYNHSPASPDSRSFSAAAPSPPSSPQFALQPPPRQGPNRSLTDALPAEVLSVEDIASPGIKTWAELKQQSAPPPPSKPAEGVSPNAAPPLPAASATTPPSEALQPYSADAALVRRTAQSLVDSAVAACMFRVGLRIGMSQSASLRGSDAKERRKGAAVATDTAPSRPAAAEPMGASTPSPFRSPAIPPRAHTQPSPFALNSSPIPLERSATYSAPPSRVREPPKSRLPPHLLDPSRRVPQLTDSVTPSSQQQQQQQLSLTVKTEADERLARALTESHAQEVSSWRTRLKAAQDALTRARQRETVALSTITRLKKALKDAESGHSALRSRLSSRGSQSRSRASRSIISVEDERPPAVPRGGPVASRGFTEGGMDDVAMNKDVASAAHLDRDRSHNDSPLSASFVDEGFLDSIHDELEVKLSNGEKN